MSIHFELPEAIEFKLRSELGDLALAGKEAMLIELYRQTRLTHHELSQALGLLRFETDADLKKHGVSEDLLTPEEYDDQIQGLTRLISP